MRWLFLLMFILMGCDSKEIVERKCINNYVYKRDGNMWVPEWSYHLHCVPVDENEKKT